MKLEEFVSETLKAVIKGVKSSQAFAKENDAIINPEIDNNISFQKSKSPVVFFNNRDGAVELTVIEFDVAITVSNQQEAEGGAGVSVLSFNVGGSINEKEFKETVSRIKFNLNVALPSTSAK